MKNKAAVLFISGQSNAHAHIQFLEEEERITEPLQNVFSLDRDPNQSFDITDVVWSGFTGAGKNLGEMQDHTASFAYFFARLWQNAIDSGVELPDLYIVQISIGGEGIINGRGIGDGMWNPQKEKVMIPGKLGEADISLHPWALQVNRLALENLRKMGKDPIVLGWHWLGSEQDTREGGYDNPGLLEIYDRFFDTMMEVIGKDSPLYLYKIYMDRFCKVQNITDEGIPVINAVLERQCRRFPKSTFVKAEECPYFDIAHPNYGIFFRDNGHYLGKTQQWFAERFFEEVRASFL
ncbi:MAG: hypothetical protein E7461_03865 [Ruminococcaceae bacterium]|nr:hypothetical protein [Oscillospiraceae bacterium]